MSDPRPQLRVERSDSQAIRRFAHRAMACEFEIFIEHTDAGYAAQAAQAAFGECDRLEAELSRFVSTSDVMRVNGSRPGEWVCVGIDLLNCIELARRIAQETGGALDLTLGAVSDRVPGARSGMDLLLIDRARRMLSWREAGARLDLGAIGKGYALDRMADILGEWSITSALLHSAQSTVLGLGGGWRVALRHPLDGQAEVTSVTLDGRAVSGSANVLHGPHIFDPRTLRPAREHLGAWALAPTAIEADALSTAFLAMDEAQIGDYCRAHRGVSAYLLDRSGFKRVEPES